MDVVHLYDGHERVYQGRGSVPDVVWSLATRTADRGHNVTVIERQWAGLPSAAEHDGVAFHRLSLRTGADEPWERIPYEQISHPLGAASLVVDRANFAIAALRSLRQSDPDVVHVHLPFAANVLVSIAPWLRSRMVYTAHLGETQKRVSEPRFSPDVYLAKRVARTIALNPTIRTAFLDRGVPRERLALVPNGVDVDRFDSVDERCQRELRASYGLDDERVVLFVGTVTPRKGVAELVEAAIDVVIGGRSSVRFVVVGRTDLDPDYVAGVRARIDEAGIGESVTFTGFVSEEELVALYDLADLFVLPSYEEGSSIAVSEAIAAGLPVVGSDIDGITQQIDHGTHGLLVAPGDVDALGASIARLLDDPEERSRMREAVADRAQDLSWERVTGEMIDVYGEVID